MTAAQTAFAWRNKIVVDEEDVFVYRVSIWAIVSCFAPAQVF